MKRILLIEDDPAVLRGLVDSLEHENYDVLTAADGEKGHSMARRENLDLIILDIRLPKKNGMDVCRDLRREGNGTPILMLTGKRGEADQVVGLGLGADDYVTKPFRMNVLLARIDALIRRKAASLRDIEEFSVGGVELDFRRGQGRRNGLDAGLTIRELEILKYLALHEGEVVTRDMLLTEVWRFGGDESIPTTRTVDNYILSIRKKIEPDPSRPVYIITVHKAGYKLLSGIGAGSGSVQARRPRD